MSQEPVIVAFDMDGTLTDTLESLCIAINQTVEHFGLKPYTRDQLRLMIGYGPYVLYQRAMPDATDEQRAEALKYYKPVLQETSKSVKAFDGIPELLQELSELPGVKTAIVSNKPDSSVQQIVKDLNLKVDLALGVTEKLREKPYPDMLQFLMEKFGSQKVVLIGDSDTDFQTAINAKIDFIIVCYGLRTQDELREMCGKDLVCYPTVAAMRERLLQWCKEQQQ